MCSSCRFVTGNRNCIFCLGSSKEYPHCFLTIIKINHLLFCGSTDGRLYVVTSSLEEVTSIRCHQSGVNALAACDVIDNGQQLCLLATGGDDNAIHLMALDISDSLNKVSSCEMKTAHSAQITGLHLRETACGVIMTSASIDQRLIKWKVNLQDSISCVPVECFFSHVADISSMCVSEKDYYLCGQGISHVVTDENT